MGRNTNNNNDMNSEISILLVVTVIIGLTLMASLLLCYACVLRRLCCGTASERAKHAAYARRTESIPMADVTLLSQQTESDRL